ncbi:hypothetical protein BGX26_005305, partial [Mortierella sp. AD094]
MTQEHVANEGLDPESYTVVGIDPGVLNTATATIIDSNQPRMFRSMTIPQGSQRYMTKHGDFTAKGGPTLHQKSITTLNTKAEARNKRIAYVNEFRTSITCCQCGTIGQIDRRALDCGGCGKGRDRDHNATINMTCVAINLINENLDRSSYSEKMTNKTDEGRIQLEMVTTRNRCKSGLASPPPLEIPLPKARRARQSKPRSEVPPEEEESETVESSSPTPTPDSNSPPPESSSLLQESYKDSSRQQQHNGNCHQLEEGVHSTDEESEKDGENIDKAEEDSEEERDDDE